MSLISSLLIHLTSKKEARVVWSIPLDSS